MQYPFPGSDELGIREINPSNYRAEFIIIPEVTKEQINDLKRLPTTKRRIRLAEGDHENLHKITNMLIYTSGFLLTICLGAIYFSYNNSSAILPLPTKILLFISAILLAFGVLASVHPLRLSRTSSLSNIEYVEMLEKLCDDQKQFTDWASRFLELAVILLLIGISLFAADRFLQSPNVLSYLENVTHYSIQVTRIS
jgi:hypothetical protein